IVRDPGTGIADRNHDFLPDAVSYSGHNLTSIRRKLQGVFVQISKNLNDTIAIASYKHGRLVALQPEANSFFACLHIELINHSIDHWNDVESFHLVLHRTGFHSRNIEEITHHRSKPLCAVVAQLNQTLLLFIERTRNLLKEQMHDLANRREGGF